MNFDFMKSGFNNVEGNDNIPEHERDFYRKVVCLMSILCEEALKTATKFVETCGRRMITGNDTILALKYESHAFWDKDIDDRFLQKLEEERQHTYETDDESEEDSDDEEEDEEEETYTTEYITGDRMFHDNIMYINQKWSEWNPQDPVKLLLKDAIEKTERRFAENEGSPDVDDENCT